jgi:hypothetical protein
MQSKKNRIGKKQPPSISSITVAGFKSIDEPTHQHPNRRSEVGSLHSFSFVAMPGQSSR